MKHFLVDSVTIHKNNAVLLARPKSPKDKAIFWPGQYMSLSLQRAEGGWTPTRSLSLTNYSNSDGTVEFGFRVIGNFTQELAAAQKGARLKITGPYGEFVVPSNERRVVLIAGGIGITPFVSMYRTWAAKNSSIDATLLYSCRSASDIPYLDQLKKISAAHPNLKVKIFVSDPNNVNSHYIPGRINKNHIIKATNDMAAAYSYYICGPENMMRAMRTACSEAGAYKQNIFTESFSSSNDKINLFGFSPSKIAYGLSAAGIVAIGAIIAVKDITRKVQSNNSTAAAQTQTVEQTTTETTDTTLNNNTVDTSTLNTETTTTPTTNNNYTAPSASTNSSSSYVSPRSNVS